MFVGRPQIGGGRSRDALGGDPLRLIGQVARIAGLGPKHAHLAAGTGQYGTRGDGGLEADAEMPRPRDLRVAEIYAVPLGLRAGSPGDMTRTVTLRHRLLDAVDPLREGGGIEIVGPERRDERPGLVNLAKRQRRFHGNEENQRDEERQWVFHNARVYTSHP